MELSNGDTLSDVMGHLACGVFAAAFLHRAQSALPSLAGEQVCLDGKTPRGTRGGEGAVVSLDAMGCQKAVAEKISQGGGTTCWR